MVADELLGQTPRRAVRLIQAALERASCPDADFDARELYRHAAGRDAWTADAAGMKTDAETAARLAELTTRREKREPLQYIIGSWDFLDFTLKVGAGVLCPRADSEVVCETAVRLLQGKAKPQVLDLCAGTGCLGIGIARYIPQASVRCIENDAAAYKYLVYNTAHAVKGAGAVPVQADMFAYWRQLPPGSIDLIISNPPYLTAAEMQALMPETAREPAAALDGGADGLDFYRCLLKNYRTPLKSGGYIVLEIGCAQAEAVARLAAQNGWQDIQAQKDYGGNDRVITARSPAGK